REDTRGKRRSSTPRPWRRPLGAGRRKAENLTIPTGKRDEARHRSARGQPGGLMVSTWIEASAKGRLGGPVRARMGSYVVVGTHPVEADQEVALELLADDVPLGLLPAYWLENKGVNSFWHVPIPPQRVGARLRYWSTARKADSPPVNSPTQDVIVR